jgi:hypothetical protein
MSKKKTEPVKRAPRPPKPPKPPTYGRLVRQIVRQIVASCTVTGLTRKLREVEARLQRLDPASGLDAIIAADPSHPWAQDYRMMHNAVLRAKEKSNGLHV